MCAPGYCSRLPRHREAVLDPRKLRDYLLDLEHPVGRSKANYLARVGFSRTRWRTLERELRRLIAREPAWAMPPGLYGQEFVVRGTIRGPWRREARLVTVWISADQGAPRLVTAHPWRST
jgi:hypothetical protein